MTAASLSPLPSAPRRAVRASALALVCLLAGLPSAAWSVPDAAGRMPVSVPVTGLADASWSDVAQADTRAAADPGAALAATVSVPDAPDTPDTPDAEGAPDVLAARLVAPAPAHSGRALLASVAGGLVLCALGWRHARAPRRGGVRPR